MSKMQSWPSTTATSPNAGISIFLQFTMNLVHPVNVSSLDAIPVLIWKDLLNQFKPLIDLKSTQSSQNLERRESRQKVRAGKRQGVNSETKLWCWWGSGQSAGCQGLTGGHWWLPLQRLAYRVDGKSNIWSRMQFLIYWKLPLKHHGLSFLANKGNRHTHSPPIEPPPSLQTSPKICGVHLMQGDAWERGWWRGCLDMEQFQMQLCACSKDLHQGSHWRG